MVLKHQKVKFPTYCVEWTFEMLRDAALTTLNVGKELSARDFAMKDAHPWNILFDRCRPVFVDVGSILPKCDYPSWPYSSFRQYFLFPLLLMSAGYSDVVRAMQLRVFPAFNLGDVSRLLLGKTPFLTILKQRKADRWFWDHARSPDADYFEKLKDFVLEIPTSVPTTEWSDYQSIGERVGSEANTGWPPKLKSVDDVLEQTKPRTVLEVGCSKGWFAKLAARKGAEVIATDIDERSLTQLYTDVRRDGGAITPLLLDICQPTPAHGCGGVYKSAQDRLSADGVLSLATVHHLVFKYGMRFDAISRIHAAFAKSWLLLEFIPAEDVHVKPLMSARYDWYCRDELCRELKVYFRSIEILESSPSPRTYLMCTK
jgi:SAM-dependent methyltransferase